MNDRRLGALSLLAFAAVPAIADCPQYSVTLQVCYKVWNCLDHATWDRTFPECRYRSCDGKTLTLGGPEAVKVTAANFGTVNCWEVEGIVSGENCIKNPDGDVVPGSQYSVQGALVSVVSTTCNPSGGGGF